MLNSHMLLHCLVCSVCCFAEFFAPIEIQSITPNEMNDHLNRNDTVIIVIMPPLVRFRYRNEFLWCACERRTNITM